MNRNRFTGITAIQLMTAFTLVALLIVSAVGVAFAGPIGNGAGFEDDDGNLTPQAPTNFDWNSFSPVTWLGTAPYQNSSTTVSGWQFTGLTDAQATSSDTGFAGGTKQDLDCASVIGTKAPNKDDLERIYVAHKTVNNQIYLMLSWMRIPQNTTSPSAHVAFEFNQGTTPCGAGSPLVHRAVGDMLIVYDFTGGATDTPTLTVRRWIASGVCDISSDSAPCWGVAQNLSSSGFAEAKVNTTATAQDNVAPGGELLGLNEFGEAGINLSAAGIFSANQCTSFGQVEGVSRSSGNSGTAAMEDLVGPGQIRISNCGFLDVKKVTVPSPDPTNTSFSFAENGSNNSGVLPRTFLLTNGQTDVKQVFATNDISVAETLPSSAWVLLSATCDSGTGTLSGTTISGITVAADQTVTCTFTNKLNQGAIKVSKTSDKGGGPLSGAVFSVIGPSGSFTLTTDATGTACVDKLLYGSYTVQETAAPTGYAIDTPTPQSVTINTNSTCGSGTEVLASFTDTPLTDLLIKVTDEAAGPTTSTITCVNSSNTNIGDSPQGPTNPVEVDANGLKPGTYTCTVVIDP